MSSLYNPNLPPMGQWGEASRGAATPTNKVAVVLIAFLGILILVAVITFGVLHLKQTPPAPPTSTGGAAAAHRMALEQHAMRMAADRDATARQQQHMAQQQQQQQQQQHMAQLQQQKQQHMAQQAMYRAMREAEERKRRARYELGARPLTAKPEDAYELPAMQLSTPDVVENTVDADGLGFITASTGGTLPGAMMGTGASSTSATAFDDSAYEQDSTRMTPDAPSDGAGIDGFMPKTDAADASGRDPQTNLPVFTTSKLKRSNVLGGHGPQSFLRPVQDPLAGYKRLGKVMRITSDPRDLISGLDKRRAQYNKARVESGTEDPVLFMGSDWQMF